MSNKIARQNYMSPPPHKKLKPNSPIITIKFVKSKSQCNMINYIKYQTILQILNKIHLAVSKELHPQSQVSQTAAQTNVVFFLSPSA